MGFPVDNEGDMARGFHSFFWAIFTLALFFCFCFCIGIIVYFGRTVVTTESVSPNNAYRAKLVEKGEYSGYIDRNFDIILIEQATGKTKTIFSSPDEGRPPGTEKFMWSEDSVYLLLVG